jgi:hypothetical protein
MMATLKAWRTVSVVPAVRVSGIAILHQ